MRYIDIHSHIIPQVDDGSQTMEESLEMLRMEAEQGAMYVFLTSHAHPAYAGGRKRPCPHIMSGRLFTRKVPVG